MDPQISPPRYRFHGSGGIGSINSSRAASPSQTVYNNNNNNNNNNVNQPYLNASAVVNTNSYGSVSELNNNTSATSGVNDMSSVLLKYGYRGPPPSQHSLANHEGQPLMEGHNNNNNNNNKIVRMASPTFNGGGVAGPQLRSYRSVRDGSPSRPTAAGGNYNNNASRVSLLEERLSTASMAKEKSDKEHAALTREVADLTKKLELAHLGINNNNNNNTAGSITRALEEQQAVYNDEKRAMVENHAMSLEALAAEKTQLSSKISHLQKELEVALRSSGDKDAESVTAQQSVNAITMRFEREKATLESHLQTLQGQLRAKSDEVSAMGQQVTRERDIREAEIKESERLRDRIASLSAKLLQHENVAGQQSVSMVASLKHQQEEYEARLADLQHQLHMESSRRTREVHEKEVIARQLEEAREEAIHNRNQTLEEKRRLQEAKIATADAQQFILQCEAKEIEVRRLTEANDAQRETLAAERRAKDILDSKLAAVMAERDQLARDEAELRRHVNDQLQPMIRKLQSEATDNTNTIASLRLDAQSTLEVKSQIDHLQRFRDRLSEELNSEKTRSSDLQLAVSEAKRNILELTEALEMSKMSERTATDDLAKARYEARQFSSTEAQVALLERQLEDALRFKESAEKQAKILETSLRMKDTDMNGVVEQLAAAASYQAQTAVLQRDLEHEKSTGKRTQQMLDETRATLEGTAKELSEVVTVARDAQHSRDSAIAERNHFERLWKEERDKLFMSQEKLDEAMARITSAHLEIEHRDDINREIPYLRQQVEHLTLSRKEQHDAAKTLHEQISDATTKNVRLQLDNEELQRKISKLQIAADGADRQLIVLQDELTTVTTNFGSLQVQFDERERQSGALRVQIDALNVKVAAQSDELKSCTLLNQQQVIRLEDLSGEIAKKSDESSTWESRCVAASARVEQLEELNSIASKRITALESDNRVLAQTRNSISTLEGTVEGQQKIINDRERERSAFEAEIARLRDVEAAVHSAESKNAALTQQVEDLRRTLQKREIVIQEQDTDLTSQSASLQRLQATLTSEQRNGVITKDALVAAESQIDDLLRRLQESEEKSKLKGAVEGRLEGTQKVLEAAQSEVQSLKSQISSLEDTNKTLQREHDTVLPQLRREVKELRVHAAARQELFDSVQKELDEKVSKARQTQKLLDEATSTIHGMTQRCAELDLHLKNSLIQNERCKADNLSTLEKSDEQITRLREHIKQLKDELSALRDEVADGKESIVGLKRDVSRGQADAERYKTELGKSEHNVGKLSVEVMMLRAAMEDKSYAHDHSVQQLAEAKENFYKLQQEAAELRSKLDTTERHQLAATREKVDEVKSKEVAREAYEQEIEHIRSDRASVVNKLNVVEKQRDDIERKLFALSAEKSSLQAQLVTSEAATSAGKEAIHKEISEKQTLIAQKGDLERHVMGLESRIHKLESQLRISEKDFALLSAEAKRHEIASKSAAEDANRREQEFKFKMDVSQHKLNNLSLERDEAVAQRAAAQMGLLGVATGGPATSASSGVSRYSATSPVDYYNQSTLSMGALNASSVANNDVSSLAAPNGLASSRFGAATGGASSSATTYYGSGLTALPATGQPHSQPPYYRPGSPARPLTHTKTPDVTTTTGFAATGGALSAAYFHSAASQATRSAAISSVYGLGNGVSGGSGASLSRTRDLHYADATSTSVPAGLSTSIIATPKRLGGAASFSKY